MASTKFYLDSRRSKAGSASVLKVLISHHSKSAYISTECKITPEQWDTVNSKVINHPQKDMYNMSLMGLKCQIDGLLMRLGYENKLGKMSANDIKMAFEELHDPVKAEQNRKSKMFESRFIRFMESKSDGTKRIYKSTYNRLMAYAKEKDFRLSSLEFSEITKEWLTQFDCFLMETAPSKNARNIHFRNIRAVFNEAIDDELITCYPFRKFKIKGVVTRKRNLKIDDLRMLFNYPVEKYAVQYLDMFKLMFMLIGINTVDLVNLKEIEEGRINYYRAKTHRFYSIKVEPEAMELIEKYRGENWLLNIHDRYKTHTDYTKHINKALKEIGPVTRSGLGGKKTKSPLFPDISTYWARHSWATIAASLDIPRDVIAHALGHGNNTVTDIYIDFDQSKVDEANRKVLDWVLYGKR